MLAYILAIVVGACSLALMSAFFFVPQVHRQNDFISGALGLFFAWVLWVCAGRITGAVLLGQLAGVGAAIALGWQMMKLRWRSIPADDRALIAQTNAVVPLLAKISPEVWIDRFATSRSHAKPTPPPAATVPKTPVTTPPKPDTKPPSDTKGDRETARVEPPAPTEDAPEAAAVPPTMPDEPDTVPETPADTVFTPPPVTEPKKKGLLSPLTGLVRGVFSRRSAAPKAKTKVETKVETEDIAAPETPVAPVVPETTSEKDSETASETTVPPTTPAEEISVSPSEVAEEAATAEATTPVSEDDTLPAAEEDEKPKDSES